MGRVTDAFGRSLDDKNELTMKDKWPLLGKMMNPKRKPVREPLDVGIKVINSLLTIGGQRVGIIGSGVGKSILLKMMSKFTSADVVVVGLIGEGREVGMMVDSLMVSDGEKKLLWSLFLLTDPLMR